MGIALLLTLPMPITVCYLGDPDVGPMITGYVGSFLMSGAYLAISGMTSACTRNQVISFITSVVACLLLVLVGFPPVTNLLLKWGASSVLVDFAASLSVMFHESGEWGEYTTKSRPLIEGPNGKYWGGMNLEPANLLEKLKQFPDPPKLESWEYAVRTRNNVNGVHPNVRQATRSADLLHLASLAVRLGRKINYDPVKQEIVGDPEATRMANPPRRAPWTL